LLIESDASYGATPTGAATDAMSQDGVLPETLVILGEA
jgi:hypothetical protein